MSNLQRNGATPRQPGEEDGMLNDLDTLASSPFPSRDFEKIPLLMRPGLPSQTSVLYANHPAISIQTCGFSSIQNVITRCVRLASIESSPPDQLRVPWRDAREH